MYLGLVSTDLELIKKLRKVLGSNHKVSQRALSLRNPAWKDLYRIQIGNRYIVTKLKMYGIKPNKSLTIRLPKIPRELFGSFVRGYFDGDGNVYFKKHKVKNRKNPKWVFASRFTCGSREFLLGLQKTLTQYTNGGFLLRKFRNSGFELVYSHRDSLALYQLMYHNVPHDGLLLSRKYRLFSKAVNTLYGEMRA